MYMFLFHENAGKKIDLGDVVYVPPRVGPTLWEMGVPDRSAAEFFVPDPSPNLTNRLFVNDIHDKSVYTNPTRVVSFIMYTPESVA